MQFIFGRIAGTNVRVSWSSEVVSMCGRLTQANEDWDFMLNYFGVVETGYRMPPLYNAAPTQKISAIISDGKERRMGALHWGIIHPASQTPKGRWNTFNARAETLTVRPTFKDLISRKRCIIPVDSFYEWRKADKAPFRIRFKNQPLFPLAGLYDTWHGPNGDVVHGCTIITCKPNLFMSALHDRMPVILDDEGVGTWLNRREDNQETLLQLLKPCSDLDMYRYEVDRMVGNVRNDSRQCIEPV